MSQGWKPMVWTLAESAEVGPKAACSRKRCAAETETCGFWTPTGTASGAETRVPFETVRFSVLAGPAKPVTLRVVAFTYVVERDAVELRLGLGGEAGSGDCCGEDA